MKTLLSKLTKETFVLDLANAASIDSLQGFTVRQIDDHTLEIDVEKGQGVNAVFTALTAKGVEVLSMRNKANRLEELFVSLVENTQGVKA